MRKPVAALLVTRALVALMALMTLMTLVACTPAPASGGWTGLGAPAPGARVLGLTRSGGEILLTGSVPGPEGRAPAAWLGTPDTGWRALPVHTAGGYGTKAELIEPSADGGRLLALGRAFGGAHGNARWTLWSGGALGLTEFPQPFELLGGPRAMGVNGTATGPSGSVLSGQWDHASGTGAALWTSADGRTWTRLDGEPAPHGSPGEQTRALGVAASGTGFTAVGDARAGGRFDPVVWTSADGRAWQRSALPRPPRSTDVTADRIACVATGCAVAGLSRSDAGTQRLTCWRPAAGGWAQTTGPALDAAQLPAVTGVTFDGGRLVVTGELGGRARLWPDCGAEPPLPEDGTRATALLTEARILLSTGEKLWLSAAATG